MSTKPEADTKIDTSHQKNVMAAIEARTLSKFFVSDNQRVAALDGVSLTIRENEFFTLLGPSGCGKTTLLRLIAGFDYPSEGQILLQGKDVGGLPPNKRPINTVFQNYALFPHMTVAQNVGFGLRMLGWKSQDATARVTEMLALVRMEELKDRRTNQISGGQQQRVALARALAPRPKVLLLDEPLSALDYKLRKDMQVELKRLQAETGITFVFVTHDQEEALSMSDRIAVMNRGNILQIGSPRDIYGNPADRFVAGFIGESNFLPCTIIKQSPTATSVKLSDGTVVEAPALAGADVGSAAVLSIRPEHARTVSAADQSMLRGRIEDVMFLGSGVYVRTRLADGALFVLHDRESGAQLKPGTEVSLAFTQSSARVLRA